MSAKLHAAVKTLSLSRLMLCSGEAQPEPSHAV